MMTSVMGTRGEKTIYFTSYLTLMYDSNAVNIDGQVLHVCTGVELVLPFS